MILSIKLFKDTALLEKVPEKRVSLRNIHGHGTQYYYLAKYALQKTVFLYKFTSFPPCEYSVTGLVSKVLSITL